MKHAYWTIHYLYLLTSNDIITSNAYILHIVPFVFKCTIFLVWLKYTYILTSFHTWHIYYMNYNYTYNFIIQHMLHYSCSNNMLNLDIHGPSGSSIIPNLIMQLHNAMIFITTLHRYIDCGIL